MSNNPESKSSLPNVVVVIVSVFLMVFIVPPMVFCGGVVALAIIGEPLADHFEQQE